MNCRLIKKVISQHLPIFQGLKRRLVSYKDNLKSSQPLSVLNTGPVRANHKHGLWKCPDRVSASLSIVCFETLMPRLFPFLSMWPSDPSRSAAHCSGATRRGGSDHAGQWGKCLCVRVCVHVIRINQQLIFLSHTCCYIKFLSSKLEETLSPNQICLSRGTLSSSEWSDVVGTEGFLF